MAKYDFNNSALVRFFEDQDFLQTFVNDVAMFRTNFGFWRNDFTVDGMPTPLDDKGLAAFTVAARKIEPAVMMDMRAPLGGSKDLEKKGFSWYTGSIHHVITPCWQENAHEREYRKKIYEQFGNDANLMMQWSDSVQEKIDSANATLSNYCAQILSTGEVKHEAGRGIKHNLLKVPIPEENFSKAGKVVWTSEACPILDQMKEKEIYYRELWGMENEAFKWQIPYDVFMNCFMKNEQIRKWIMDVRTNREQATTDTMPFTTEEIQSYLSLYPGLSPIEIVVEKQYDHSGPVHGWKANTVVFRPVGYAGVIKHTEDLDQYMYENYGNSLVQKTFAKVGDAGLFTLMNITRVDGDYKSWKSELYGSFIPTLTEHPYHVIIDISTADE